VRARGSRLSFVLLACAWACADDSTTEADSSADQCQGEPAPFANGELIEWFGYGHDFAEFCSGGVAISEDHARWVAQQWGTEPAAFRYNLFESIDDPCWPCPNSTIACVKQDLFATWVPDRHEIVHAVRPGICFTLIEEGYAMLYGEHFIDAPTDGDIRVALDEAGSLLPGSYYPLAARFVAFLLETRGVDQLRALCERDASDSQAFEQAVLQTYGESFDDLATEFDTYPEWSLAELRQDQACESGDVLVQPAEWDFRFACDEPGVEGKLGRAWDTQRLVELPEDGMYQFVFEAAWDLQLEIELRNCTRDGMASIYFLQAYRHVEPGITKVIMDLAPVPAGVYVVRVRVREPSEPVAMHVSVKPWP
jgi:hypothetical protein